VLEVTVNRLSAAAFFVWGGLACLGGCGSGGDGTGPAANLSSSDGQVAGKVGGSFADPTVQPRLQASNFQVTSDWGSGYGATSVEAYLAAGVPASKLLLGIPSYGRAWKNVVPPGIGKAAGGLPQGTFEAGVFDYKDLMAKLRSTPGVWIRQWDAAAQAVWISAPTVQGSVVVSYEDAQSLQGKLRYLSSKGLAGAMLWDLSSDLAPTDPDSLVGIARRFLR